MSDVCVRRISGLYRNVLALGLIAVVSLTVVEAASAQVAAPASCAGPGECLCDNAYQDCRAPLLELIKRENVGIDVSLWFLTDWRYRAEIINRWKAGVPVRIIVDTQADTYAANKTERQYFVNAGIPIRDCIASGINHWKAMIFAGQAKVQFSAANFSTGSFSPTEPYLGYVDEAIYFTDDPAIVQSFMRKFDDHWTNTSSFTNLANITGPLTREYPTYTVSGDLNFVPDQNFQTRLKSEIEKEAEQIDVMMFRITSATIPDALIARHQAGVPVRVITDVSQYRNSNYFWHAYNVDRMYMAGIPVKVKVNITDQDMHQKSIVLYSRARAAAPAPMVVFGSSNWTSSSATSQREHNYFTRKAWMVNWFIAQFERKWNNRKADGSPLGTTLYVPLAPRAPDLPVYASPANQAVGIGSSVTLKWEGGYWAHKYDVYVDTDPNFTAPPVITNYMPGSTTAGLSSTKESQTISNLLPGTTYYWRVVSKTMANRTRVGLTWSFRTSGTTPAPTGVTINPNDIVLYAAEASAIAGNWSAVGDASAAGGRRLENRDLGAALVTSPHVSPAHYFELRFQVQAGIPYRLWMRGKAASNNGSNDSVWVQFSKAVNRSGAAIWRIRSADATRVNLADCSTCALSGWGWQDNGFGVGILGPVVYFAESGPQTIRVQVREDGISIDQIVLSPTTFLNSAPGRLTNDVVILPRQNGF